MFVSTLKTSGGLHISVPNSQLWNTAITNYSRNPTRRVTIVVGIGYGDDTDLGLAVLLDLMAQDGRAFDDPGPQTMVTALGASSIDITMRCWCNSGDYWDLFCDLNKGVKETLDKAGISIPYPQQDVHLHQIGGPAA